MKPLVLLMTLVPILANASWMWGNGTITEEEQFILAQIPNGWNDRNGVLPIQPCYFRDGTAVNDGLCRGDMGVFERSHCPEGKTREPKYTVTVVPTMQAMWDSCALGGEIDTRIKACTIALANPESQFDQYLVIVPDTTNREELIRHELQCHVFNDVRHPAITAR